MTNIYTQAYNARKPKKDEVQRLLEELYEGANDSLKLQLAEAYKYFMPSKIKKPKTVFEWLSMACGKEETRRYLHFIWCDGEGNAVSTNGHILLKAPCDKEKGFYDRNGNKIERKADFLDWQRVFPDTKGCAEIEGFDIITDKYSAAKDIDTEHGFNTAYLDTALSYGGDYKALWNGGGNPMVLTFDDGRQALIMPVGNVK